MHRSSLFAYLLLCFIFLGFPSNILSIENSQNSASASSLSVSEKATTPPEVLSSKKTTSPPSLIKDDPNWPRDMIWYQIFAERFRNGDTQNDPDYESLGVYATKVPSISWKTTAWGKDWYSRDFWEEQMSSDFWGSITSRRYGGDLQGVIDKLDYLQELGITAIYFNPVFFSISEHKYDSASFHHIDPFFGPKPFDDLDMIALETTDPSSWKWTSADKLFFELLKQAHARGIRVVLDGVFNHCGREFFAFKNLKKHQKDSPYLEWFTVDSLIDVKTGRGRFGYKGWWGIASLPVFAHTPDGTDMKPGPKSYIFEITKRWMDPNGDGDPSDGVDGWRLDVAEEVPIQFWKDWNLYVRSINPNAYTVCEHWGESSHFVSQGGFSASMNYHGFAKPVKGFIIDSSIKASEFSKMLDSRRAHLLDASEKTPYEMQNLMDSHDTDRLASMIVNRTKNYSKRDVFDYDLDDAVKVRKNKRYKVHSPKEEGRKIQRLVALFQAGYVGAPMIYYGTESGMWGGDDPCDRKPMVWQDIEYEPESAMPSGPPKSSPEEISFNKPLHDFYRGCFALRKKWSPLRRGTYRTVYTNDTSRTFAFARRYAGENIIIALNRNLTQETLEIKLTSLDQAPSYRPIFSTETDIASILVSIEPPSTLKVVLPPLSGVVLFAEKK